MKSGYFVGIGAQKAGTTWLARYLSRHPEVFFSPEKELHFFDRLIHPSYNRFFVQRLISVCNAIPKDAKKVSNGRLSHLESLIARLKMTTDPQEYGRYFRAHAHGVKAFGEITPAYSLLDRDGFGQVLAIFPDAKFIFLLRDPVSRFWSQVRFQHSRQPAFDPVSQFEACLRNPGFSQRTDYRRTLEELLKVAAASRVLVLFYETLFSPAGHDEVRRLTDFLDISYQEADIHKAYNVSGTRALPEHLREQAVQTFSHVYSYIYERYGSQVPAGWERPPE